MEPLKLAHLIAEEALDTKGQEIKILDLRKLVSFTDYFVLVTGTSTRHVQAIADRVNFKLKKQYRLLPLSFEGYSMGQWVLLDYADVVLHVFLSEQREFYGLDELWSDAPVVPVRAKIGKKPARKVPAKAKGSKKSTKKKKSS